MNMRIAHVTLIRGDAETATIIARQQVETVPFWKITWAPQHVVLHVNPDDENEIIVYKADRVFELVTENIDDH